jgi:hypothetical protein
MGTNITGQNARLEGYPTPSSSGGSTFPADAEQAFNDGPVILNDVAQTVVSTGAIILVGPSGKILANYSGDAIFININDIATVWLKLDSDPVVAALNVQAPSTITSGSNTMPISRSWLFTGLVPGSAHSVDALMASSGIGDGAAHNVLDIWTF